MSHVSTTSLSCNAHMSSLTACWQHAAHTRAKTITLRLHLVLDTQQRRLHGDKTVLTTLYLTSNKCLTSNVAQIQCRKVNHHSDAHQVVCAFQSERRIRQVHMCDALNKIYIYLCYLKDKSVIVHVLEIVCLMHAIRQWHTFHSISCASDGN